MLAINEVNTIEAMMCHLAFPIHACFFQNLQWCMINVVNFSTKGKRSTTLLICLYVSIYVISEYRSILFICK